MKKMKWLGFTLMLIALMALVACGGNDGADTDEGTDDTAEEESAESGDAGEAIKIIAAHNQTDPENPYQDGLLKFKEVAENESDGAIEVEVHAGTIGTEEVELVEKLKLGAADVVLFYPVIMSSTLLEDI